MSKHHSFYDTVDHIIHYGIEQGILHLGTSVQPFSSNRIMIGDKPVLNFGSCSYLGLEFHPLLKEGAKDAINKYGTQFSASRAYISLGLYQELQSLLEMIFEAPCVITPTTTLGHIAAIPVLVRDEDAVILDQQVHNSVQTATQLLKARAIPIELIRHNRMDLLEEKIKTLREKHKRIWFMADGIYSMFGDTCPIETVYTLMEKYPELYFYVDDAHGMSIHGKNGRGFTLSHHTIHTKMVMATSLNKAFASGGGVLVFGDPEQARLVGNVGGPLLSSGPMQPSALGAAIAAAKMHLSETITELQQQLKENIRYTNALLGESELPLVSASDSAIFFIGVSLPKAGHHIVRKMLDAGFYVNLGIFPTVPMKQTGIRFTITRLHTREDIASMISTLKDIFQTILQQEGVTLPEIYKAFRIGLPVTEKNIDPPYQLSSTNNFVEQLQLQHFNSIKDIGKCAWDDLFAGRGSFDWEGLNLLEKAFSNNAAARDNWKFDYIFIKDAGGKTVLASFLTTALWKDDMLSPAAVSEQIEIKRTVQPEYLTSTVTCCGSLLTEGEHLYINFDSPLWKKAMEQFFNRVYSLQALYQSNHIVLRDFHAIHPELDTLMVDNGFFRINMPDAYIIPSIDWQTPREFYNRLSPNKRSHIRKKVWRHEQKFKVEIIKVSAWQEEIEHWYQLYRNVKAQSLELNTFPLPLKLFHQLAESEHWEMLQLSLKNDSGAETTPCCVVFSCKTESTYIPMIIGMDYTMNAAFGIYRQALYQVLMRAKKAGKQKVLFGFSAGIEKQKLGAVALETYAYMHTTDSYNMEMLSVLPATRKLIPGNTHSLSQNSTVE